MAARALVLALLISALATPAVAETKEPDAPEAAPAIQWFGTWERAKAEAKKTGRPILLTAAAPACNGVPGIW